MVEKQPEASTQIRVPNEFKPLIEDLTELTRDGQNPNRMTKSQREALWRSLDKFGWIMPIIVDSEGLIADGEQKLETCLNHEEYYGPVLRVSVDDKDRRLLRQVANKLKGQHNQKLDRDEYRRIVDAQGQGDLIRLLQLSEKELLKALENPEAPAEDGGPDLLDVDTDIELGDVYTLGAHRLMCGDAQNPTHLEALLNGEKADIILTDPPYGIDVVSRDESKSEGITFGKVGKDAPISFGKVDHETRIIKAKTYLKVEGDDKPFDPTHMIGLAKTLLLFGGNYYASKLPDSPGWMVWDKNDGREFEGLDYADAELIYTNVKRHTKIYRVLWKGMFKDAGEGVRIHPTQKPVKLIKLLLADFTKPGQRVLDPYAGSGSTLIACEVLERPCYLMEIVPQYCQYIINRWEAYTGQKAQKVTGEEGT